MNVKYPKAAQTRENHINLLKERGLIIENDELALHYLRYINYFRLTGYMKSFTNDKDQFRENTTFEDVINLYNFDRKLRLLCLDAIERIEIALRSTMVNCLAVSNGAFWHLNSDNFSHEEEHAEIVKHIKFQISKSNDLFIEDHNTKHQDIEHPCWMAFEVISLGTLSKIYAYMFSKQKKEIANKFDLNPNTFESWIRAISYTRNLCAHHSRLWNRVFVKQPTFAKNPYKESFRIDGEYQNNRFFSQALIIQALLSKVSPESQWIIYLDQLLNEFPNIHQKSMGLPEDWKSRTPFAEYFLENNIEALSAHQ